jgi:hypothetical protein
MPKGNPHPVGGRRKSPAFKVAHMAEALRKGAGIPSAAAAILAKAYGSCSPETVRNYLKRYPRLQETINAQIEINLDTAEAKLLTAINEGRDWAVKFYLETKGKSRGYSKRTEIAGVPGQPLVMTDARQWIVDQLDEMESRLRSQPSGESGPPAAPGPAETPAQTVH